MKELLFLELRSNLFSGRFAGACLLMVLAFLASLGMMYHEYGNLERNYVDSLSLKANELFFDNFWYWEHEDGRTDDSNTITWPMAKVKKPEPLLFLSMGTTRITSQSTEFINKFPIIETTTNAEQEANLIKILFPAPDLLLVVKVLVSLVALLFGYSIICGERERGTLKLVLVSGTSRSSTFIGKHLGGLVSIWLAFSVAFLVYLLALVLFTPVEFGGEIPIRIGLISLTGLLFIAVFYSLGVAISSFSRISASSLILALFSWLFFIFILPGTAPLVAQQFVQIESKDKLARMKLEKAQAMERAYAEAHPEDTDSGSTAGYGRVHNAIRQQIADEMEKIDKEFRRKKDVQIELTSNLSRISPVGSVTFLFSSLSKTGLEDARRFRQDLQEIKDGIYSAFMAAALKPEVIESFRSTSFDIHPRARALLMGLFNIAEKYMFTSPNIGETLESCWLDFALLLFPVVILFLLGFIRFLSYDPR